MIHWFIKLLAWFRFNLNQAESVVWVRGNNYSPAHGYETLVVNNYPAQKVQTIIVKGIPSLCVYFDPKAHAIAFGSYTAKRFWFWFWGLDVPLEQS